MRRGSGAAFATALETSAVHARSWEEATWQLDTATMIRVSAGGAARHGGPFDWDESGSGCSAIGPNGTKWSIVPRAGGYGIIVADWDAPDWRCADLETAKRIAEEIDARPNFPKHLATEELPRSD